MRHRTVLVVVVASLAVSAPAAMAGGPFDQIVAVGAGGRSATLRLAPSGPRSEDSLGGVGVSAPKGGYVRVYTLIGGLPGVPGRYYPARRVLCMAWSERPTGCQRLVAAGHRLLAPLDRLPRLRGAPTVLVRVHPDSGVVRTLNVHLGIELALARPPLQTSGEPSSHALVLSLTWRGPAAQARPARILLDRRGVWSAGRLYPTPPGVWSYVADNQP
jgi:hypothetical protein